LGGRPVTNGREQKPGPKGRLKHYLLLIEARRQENAGGFFKAAGIRRVTW